MRHDAVIAAGGLHIVGTERHESRRIDNQLRGRAGRQGDPGSSRFYLSLEDPLLRIFGGERLGSIMQRLKMPEGEPIEHPIVNRSIAKAQNRVETRNFDIRKQLLEYDDVANDQRRVIYQQRNELLESKDIADTIRNMIVGLIDETVRRYIPPESIEEQWDVSGLESALTAEYQMSAPVAEWLKTDPEITDVSVRDRLTEAALAQYSSKEMQVGPELMRQFERSLMLQTLDQQWRDHLANLDHLRQGIHLRGYAQKNPKEDTSARRSSSSPTCSTGSSRTSSRSSSPCRCERRRTCRRSRKRRRSRTSSTSTRITTPRSRRKRRKRRLSQWRRRRSCAPAARWRNDPCPCGSGKKYKQCHGRLA